MRITKEQEQILDTFTCERLSLDLANKSVVEAFSCERGLALVQYLQHYAWREDQEGTTAYYLIKNAEGVALLFFSLKCGALFVPLNEEERLKRVAAFEKLLETVRSTDCRDKEDRQQLIERLRCGLNIPSDRFRNIKMAIERDAKALQQANADRAQEPNEMIVRVGETYPGIELVHFCANDCARDFWKSCNIAHPMGEVLFWKYIAPIISDIQRLIGCQYVFLFAADTSPDRLLVNYYDVSLKFHQPDDVGANKPIYDFCCEFMCQKIGDLMENQRTYFENFNPDGAEDIV